MARRDEGCASIGCLGICFLAVVGMCSGLGSGTSGSSGSVPIDAPSTSAPALPPPTPPVVVEDARPSEPRELRVGPRGGCYYVTDGGEKNYVDRSECRRAGASADPRPLAAPGAEPSEARPSGAGSPSIDGAGTYAAPQPLVPAGSGFAPDAGSRAPGFPQLHVGPRGGCYYISDSGSKRYVDRAACRRAGGSAAPEPLTAIGSGSAGGGSRRSGGGRQLHVGPRGGCYYINGSGNKTYVDRSECY